jgi:hypothetical protein
MTKFSPRRSGPYEIFEIELGSLYLKGISLKQCRASAIAASRVSDLLALSG